MFFALYAKLVNLSPRFKKKSKHILYQYIARKTRGEGWKFMNYGFSSAPDDPAQPELEPADEPHRRQIQLYHHVTRTVSLEGLKVLDIGCGRGGGVDYLERYLKVKTVIGLDYSDKVLADCKKNYSAQPLAFIAGDAEALPFTDQAFDAVLNVESSHCYSDMEKFLGEVRRVLRPGGHFLFADFRDCRHLPLLDTYLQQSGLALQSKADITHHVKTALDADTASRLAFIKKRSPKVLVKLFKEFGGCKGSRVYERFKNGQSAYFSYVFEKQAE